MGTVLRFPLPADQPRMPSAIHLISGDVVLREPTFRLTGDALEHARHELVRQGCDYAVVALIDAAIKALGVAAEARDPLHPAPH